MWPNLLSLDATFIAVLWQHFLAETLSPIHPAATAVLGLSVWLVYTADRLFDTLAPESPAETPRHRFARRYRVSLSVALIPIFALDLGLALRYLPREHFIAGLALLLAVGARFLAVLFPFARNWGKEFWTALIFAAGVWTPILIANPWRPGAVLFALLCWWNCSAIDTWETQLPARSLITPAALLAMAAMGFFTLTLRPVALAEVFTAAGFCLLALSAHRLTPNARRVAVDLCLLSPLIVHAR